MADKSLIEKIHKYITVANNINPPTTKAETELFERILNRENIFNYSPLDISRLRAIINKVKDEEAESAIAFYTGVANELGIGYIESEHGKESNGVQDGSEMDVEMKENTDDEAGNGKDGSEDKNNEAELREETNENSVNITNEPVDQEYTWNIEGSELRKDIGGSFENSVFGYNLGECTQKLRLKKALLLMGVPGTGKTTLLKHLIHTLAGGDRDRYKLVSFSQNTDYTDFIGGLVCVGGRWTYKDGTLTEICKNADRNRDKEYYLGIDEMSRGNTEAIFGELMTGIEHRDTLINLKNGKTLVIPSNLYIIGTMNISDNSTKRLDIATLERFTKYFIKPQWTDRYIDWICDRNGADSKVTKRLKKIGQMMRNINAIIEEDRLLGKDKVIGTRAISGIRLSLDNVRVAIHSQLVPDIEQRMVNSSNSEELEYYIEEIVKAVG